MNQPLNSTTTFGSSVSSAARNKVLRNTYWLLAISLLPTVAGAWIGVATGITAALSGMMGLVVFLGGAFGFIYAINKTKNSAAGVPVLLGFTFFMGLMISRLIAMVLGFSNGADLVMMAFRHRRRIFRHGQHGDRCQARLERTQPMAHHWCHPTGGGYAHQHVRSELHRHGGSIHVGRRHF